MFLDGTKFEANANKYKFVWKPTTFHNKLNDNIKLLLEKYFELSNSKKTFISKEIAEYLASLIDLAKQQGFDVSCVKTGKGHKSIPIIKDIKKLEDYLNKSLEYEEKEEICGNRNSFYKTDKDATTMCLKEDYYSGLGILQKKTSGNLSDGYLFILISMYVFMYIFNKLGYYISERNNHDYHKFHFV